MGKKLTAITLLTLACTPGRPGGLEPDRPRPAAITDSIPGTLVTFDMVPVPGDPPLLIGKTEVTWDEYDVFAYRLDQPTINLPPADTARPGLADATARPSRPYGAPDYGWGHQGYPAISIAAPVTTSRSITCCGTCATGKSGETTLVTGA
jgi:hypothetical protein